MESARAWAGCVLLACVSLFGCSGGGSSGPPADLAGHWLLWVDLTGEEIGPFPLFVSQNGTALDGAAMTGTVSGNSFTLNEMEQGFVVATLSGTVTGNTAQGTMTIPDFSLSGPFRMQPFQPAGSLVVMGEINGEPTNVDTMVAVGAREYSDRALTVLQEVEVTFADANLSLELEFVASGLRTGTLNVGSGVFVDVDYTSDTASFTHVGTGGTMTVTQYDDAGFTAAFSITLDSGDVIVGSFDVVWDIEAYEP